MELKSCYQIKGGVYLVVDLAMDATQLFLQLEMALQEGLCAVQLWDNGAGETLLNQIDNIAGVCHKYRVPLLVNNNWQVLQHCAGVDGVHFDDIPTNFAEIKSKIDRRFLAGITCSSNLEVVSWAQQNQFNYISFCAMFPSSSVSSCNLVMPATVAQARKISNLPLFLSGGMTPGNTAALKRKIDFDGIAVISGIMHAENPTQVIREYKNALFKHN